MLSPVSNLKHWTRVWLSGTRASLVREMEFRGNFIAGLIRQLIWVSIFVLMVEVMFSNTNQLAGWDHAEVLLLLALSRIIEGLMNALFINNLMHLPEIVQQGKFDFHLVKPLPVQFYTSLRSANINQTANIVAGVFLLFYASTAAHISLFTVSWLWLGFLAIAGMIIYYSLLIIAASLVFVLERLEFLWGFNMIISEPLTVPFDIFPSGARVSLTYLLPLAFIVYVPAQAVTGRLTGQTIILAFFIAAITLTLANLAWRAGLRRYSSASS
ncbi:MAG: ABC-2 family transporter protein [Candidatus Andersenbacteria bacterium]|nr:ABC-2 family transporter protein [bacterium]MDZ4225845.1 ABC-2 family transporter protein [Candidatus Andersenbacteria bacterium]